MCIIDLAAVLLVLKLTETSWLVLKLLIVLKLFLGRAETKFLRDIAEFFSSR